MKKHNEYYWDGRNERAKQAKVHTDEMSKRFPNEIAESIKNTVVYDNSFKPKGIAEGDLGLDGVTCTVLQEDTVSAIFEKTEGKIAALNFASYKEPGGGFLNGSRAQEECLCHESTLYNVLSQKMDYYEWNRANLNHALYKPRALYSPDIIFEKNGIVKKCDVITCAAPNYSAASKFVTLEENNRVLEGRIKFILEIAKDQKVDTLILGAFGCGVFQQKPEVVARLFDKHIKSTFYNEKINVIFAIIPPLPHQTNNLAPFIKQFNK